MQRSVGFCFLFSLQILSLSHLSQAQAKSPVTITYPSLQGAVLGTGWNINKIQKTNSICVVGSTHHDTGSDQTLIFQRVIDTDALMRSLSVSAEAKASSIMGGSASASATFSKKTSVETENVNITAKATVTLGAEFLIPTSAREALSDVADTSDKLQVLSDSNVRGISFDVGLSELFREYSMIDRYDLVRELIDQVGGGQIRLTDSAATLARKNPAKFLNDCGDGFIGAIVSGGALEAMYSFASRKSSDREEVTTKLSGSFPIGSASASISSVVEDIAAHNTTTIVYHGVGGSGDPLPITQEKIEGKIQSLPVVTAASPSPLLISVVDYRDLPNFPKSNGRELSNLDAITSKYYQFTSLRFALDSVILHPDLYTIDYGVTLDGIKSLQDSVERYRDMLTRATEACLADKPCLYPSEVPENDYETRSHLPILRLLDQTGLDIAAAQQKMANLNAELKKTPRDIDIGGFPGGIKINIPNPKYDELTKNIASLSMRITSLEQQWPRDQVIARYNIWIEEAARSRCKEQFEQPCFANREMSTIQSAMLNSAGLKP